MPISSPSDRAPEAPPSILARLKNETRPSHEATEDVLGRWKPTTDLDGYRLVLGRFLGFHEPVEQVFARLGGWEAYGLDVAERRKAGMLRADLRALGLDDATIDALPRCADLPPLATRAEAFGALYVLEGSTLGGQYIRKQVEPAFGLTPAAGSAYFASYGDRVGPMWKAFGAGLTAYAESTGPDDRDAVVRSALATFDAVGRWFASPESA